MLGLARTLFRAGSEERLSMADWVEMFSFNGNSYPINYGSSDASSGTEQIANDFEGYVQNYKTNGVVFAVVNARSRIFSQARFQYQKLNKGRPGDLFSTPDLGVLEVPWLNGSTAEALTRAMQDADLAGNSYTLREGFGRSLRLRRLRPDWVDILLTAPPDKAVKSDVAAYIYKPGGTNDPDAWVIYPADGSMGTIAHWSPIPDPSAQYRGMSWLTPVLMDVMTDRSIEKFKSKYFSNGARPSLVVSLKETVTPDQFDRFMEKVNRHHQGVDNMNKTMYLGGGADVHVVGSNLADIAMKDLGSHLETRIASAGAIHPTLLGLAENIHGSELNSGNFQAAKDLLYESFLSSAWPSLCTAWAQLVPKQQGARLWYDTRDIPLLRQDQQKAAEIGQVQAATIASLIQAGFTPKSATAAVVSDYDFSLLVHTNLYSVQLIPPGDGAGANDPGSAPDKPVKDKKSGQGGS